MQYNIILRIFSIILLYFAFYSNVALSNETYFDLSDSEIEIQTNFKGKEVIIFGLLEPGFDTIINIKGPKKNTEIRKKERIFVFWFNTKKIVYKDLPSIFFIASSAPIKNILEEETIIKSALNFEQSLANIVTKRNFNFNDKNKPEFWNENLLKIKKNEDFYKEYNIKIVDDKLFQTKIFFPSNTVPGIYDVDIYQIKNKIIKNKKNRKIIIKKTGIGNRIFRLAHKQPATYGIICIIFAIFAGLIAATAFRRL
ncbi:MAG: hypothetical protein CFH18_00034 [Alphaproteobacteria bacterium MarineAlpha5_Bin8]|nr:MAG: hypothetical protein CFH17_00402 [Alphaproteobacteria bacterium MarineAlpha5_Bin7]PPR48418.1 MAG: hypothetical protein CFH18_00034 [Alphaproteobacteria bacterium MarineAlpha5_Bin8]PPR54415.1 MAG: hypothetical protein CFH16_00448 [Alphaproteobacteria bacterium MarineAlpha5_Bin6]|tara:strand:- start:48 stop:809 length:762 start_codon:yes stop_codon:yes gene_type:complete